MAEGDDDIVSLAPRGAAAPTPYRPTVGFADDDIRPLDQKPVLNTSFNKVPSTEHGEGSVWRNLGLGTREAIEGRASLPLMIADAVTWPGRAIQSQLGLPRGTAPSDLVTKGLDAVGLPNPQTETEKANSEIIRGGAALIGPGIGLPRLGPQLPPVVQPYVPKPVTSLPGAASQVVAGGTGAAAGDILANREEVPEWAKPTARLVGNIVGAGGVSGLTGALGTLHNIYTGTKSEIGAALDRLRIKPGTAGAVSTSPGVQTTEGGASRLPSAAGTLKPAQQETVDQFGNAVERTAQRLTPAGTAQEAGEKVQTLLRDWKETAWPAEQARDWAPLNQRMSGAAVDPTPYRNALEYAASPPALATLPENQRAFASAQAKKWLDALDKDVPPGNMMTWEQAHALKQRIGDAMGTPDIVSSIGNTQLKNIYGGLAQSMEKTATQHGQAGLFSKANQTTIDGHQFIDGTLSKAVEKNNAGQELIRPDDAARRLVGDNTAMQQLRDRVPEAADHLAGWKLRDMAQAKPSQQGAGDTTSTGTFLTGMRGHQLQKPEGNAALFDPVQGHVNDLMTVAAQLRNVEQNVNRSNTAATGQIVSLGPQIWQAYEAGGWKAVMGTAAANYLGPKLTAQVLASRPAIAYAAAQKGAGTPGGGLLAGALSSQATMPNDQRR